MADSAHLNGVDLAYEELGDRSGEPVVLICGCGQPAAGWHAGVAPTLAGAGFRVVAFDNRGMAPSGSPPAPYSIDLMAADALELADHLGIGRAHFAGYSMGGWIAETLAARHGERVATATFIGSCNVATSWEVAITTVERDLARLDLNLPPLFYATETLRYLPNHDLQDDDTVDAWLSLIGDEEPWPNPGRLGQYEACLAWSTRADQGKWWSEIVAPCLVVAFEHDVDSPPAAARMAAARFADARVAEIAGASHLGPFSHAAQVGEALVEFLTDHPL